MFITGRRAEELDKAVKEIAENVVGIQGDVSKNTDLDRLFDQIKREAGRLDVVVANAGSGELVPFGSYTEEHIDKTFDVNIKGTVLQSKNRYRCCPSAHRLSSSVPSQVFRGRLPSEPMPQARLRCERSFELGPWT